MLIKIANHPYLDGSISNSFMLFDKVDNIESFCPQPNEISTEEGLKQLLMFFPTLSSEAQIKILNQERINDFLSIDHGIVGRPPLEELSQLKIYRANKLVFTRADKKYYIDFDTIAYICSDKGKTLEKCFAGGVLHK